MISKQSLVSNPAFLEGEVILFDKELNWSSFDVVNSLKIFLKFEFRIKKIKVGHAGTLDPRATGLVIVCTGKKTKEIESYQAQEKEYTGAFYLGNTTPSFDSETETDQNFSVDHITEELIRETTKQFTGEIIQVPPVYSALKIDGKKAYEYARKNKPVKMRQRIVHIFGFDIEKIELPLVYFRVRCSKGTYIRSLANDFGKALKSGAYLASLRRTAIGEYQVKDAFTIAEFKEHFIQKQGE